MLPPIDDDIITQHLNIVVCNCNSCVIDKKICSSRIKTIIRALENQIETIENQDEVKWKKEILKIIKENESNSIIQKNESNSINNLASIEMQLLAEKCLYFLASEIYMSNQKFIKFINEYSDKFSKCQILLSLYSENSKLNKYYIVYSNLFSICDKIEFNWQKIGNPIINTFYINKN